MRSQTTFQPERGEFRLPKPRNRKRQRTAVIQDASPRSNALEDAPAFGLRQSSAAFCPSASASCRSFSRRPALLALVIVLLGFVVVISPLLAAAPFSATQAAIQVTPTGAVLGGMAVPNGQPASAWFDWGIKGSYTFQTSPCPGGTGRERGPCHQPDQRSPAGKHFSVPARSQQFRGCDLWRDAPAEHRSKGD